MAKFRIALLLLAAVMVFAACSGPVGVETGGLSTAPRNINFDALYETLLEASSHIAEDNPAVAGAAYQGPFYLILFAGYIEAWDGSSSYTYGPITVTVSESGGIWTWSYTDNNTGQSMVYLIEQTVSGWDFSWTIDGIVYVSGSMSSDGYTAQVNVYDVDNDPNDVLVSYSSAPYIGAFDLEIISTSYSAGSADYQMVIRTNTGGAAGEWSYDSNADGDLADPGDDSGSWPTP